MTKRFLTVALVPLLCAGSANELVACGDKFLSAARGTRFQQAPKGRQEAILIYAHPSSEVPAAMARVSAESALAAAGYRPTTVSTASDFERALGNRQWDLVLAGLPDAERIGAEGRLAARILPVALQSGKIQLRDANSRYPVVLTKAPSSQGLLRAVAKALAHRAGVESD
jgi:hypothetical protein